MCTRDAVHVHAWLCMLHTSAAPVTGTCTSVDLHSAGSQQQQQQITVSVPDGQLKEGQMLIKCIHQAAQALHQPNMSLGFTSGKLTIIFLSLENSQQLMMRCIYACRALDRTCAYP